MKWLLALPLLLVALPAAAQQGVIVDTCMPGPWVIQFDLDTIAMEANGPKILDAMSENDGGCYSSPVVIDGFIDTGETADLATRRALAVRDGLIARGLPADRIYIPGLGSTRSSPRAHLNAEKRSPENARVEISWGRPQ